MHDIKIIKYNDVFLKIETEPSILYELRDEFCFEVPGARFTPAFRAKKWNGKIYLFNISTKLIYKGLLPYILDFCNQRNYKFDLDNSSDKKFELSKEKVRRYINDLEISYKGDLLIPHDHQIDATHHILNNSRCLLTSPTACLDPNTKIEVEIDEDAINFLRM